MGKLDCDYRHAATSLIQRGAVEACVAALKLWGLHKFEAIAWTGNSGGMVAPVVAYLLEKHQLAIRKPRQSSHTEARVDRPVEGLSHYVIVDDFVATGTTVKQIIDTLREEMPFVHCAGVLEYCHLMGGRGYRIIPGINSINKEISHA